MKVLIIAPTPFFSDRGCHIRIYEEAKALKQKGHEADIFTYHLGKNIEGFNIKRIINIPWYKKTSAGASWHKLYLDWLLLWKILLASFFTKYDVIHAHLHEGCLIGWVVKIAHFGKIKLIFDSQGSLVEEMTSHDYLKQSLIKKIFIKLEKFINNRADKIITSSNFLPGAIVVPDGVNWPKNQMEQPKEKTIIYTGGLTKDKGVEKLFEVMKQINAKLLVIGYPVLEEYKQIAPDKIKFLGQQSYFDLPKYLAQAEVAVDPKPMTSSEASGKIINYMAAGLKIVAYPSKHNQELLGDLGFYIENDIADTLRKALEAENTIANKEKQLIKEKYDWQNNINKIIQTYES